MFCAKCGKEIDNNSIFCPFCGQKVGEPVEQIKFGSKIKSVGQKGIQQMPVLQGFIHNRKLCVFILAFVAVVAVVSGVVKLAGGKQTVPEKLYEMSWEDRSEFSIDDFMDYLDSRDIEYAKKSSSYSYNVGCDVDVFITTYSERVFMKEFEPFFGGDCIAVYDTAGFRSSYIIGYKTYEEFEKGLNAIENDIKKSCVACKKENFDEHSLHLTEVTKENINSCIEGKIKNSAYSGLGVNSREEYEEAIRNKYSAPDYAVCKEVSIGSIDIDNDLFDYYDHYPDNTFPDEFREIYSREMFAPYSCFCSVNVCYGLVSESDIKE